MSTTTLIDPRLRVAHLIVPLMPGPELSIQARTALEFAGRCANRVTLLCLAGEDLSVIDSAMRRLALLVSSGLARDAAVKVVLRQGNAVPAVAALLEQDSGFIWSGGDADLQQNFDCVEG